MEAKYLLLLLEAHEEKSQHCYTPTLSSNSTLESTTSNCGKSKNKWAKNCNNGKGAYGGGNSNGSTNADPFAGDLQSSANQDT